MNYFFLFLFYLCSAGFFGIQGNPIDIFNFQAQDVILILSTIFVSVKIKKLNTFLLTPHKIFLTLFIYCFISSITMAYLNFEQPFFYSILTARLFLTYLFLYLSILLLIKNSKLEYSSINTIVTIVSLFLVLLNFYIYLTANYELMTNLNVQERFDDVRFMIGGGTVIYLTLYFIYNLGFSKLNYFILLALFALLLLISKTRGIIIPMCACLILSFLEKQGLSLLMKNVFRILVIVLILGLVFGIDNVISPLEKIFQSTNEEISKSSGNYGFRIEELVFFLNNLNFHSIIFGYGLDNNKFVQLYANDSTNYYLSDLGVFRIFYYHGVIGLFLFIKVLLLLYKESKFGATPVHKFGKGFVIFQLFSFATITFFYTIESVFIFFTTYIALKTLNSRSNLIKNRV